MKLVELCFSKEIKFNKVLKQKKKKKINENFKIKR